MTGSNKVKVSLIRSKVNKVTTATSLASFKKQLNTFLFTKSFPEF